MQNEDLSIEEMEAEIARYQEWIAQAKAQPGYEDDPEIRAIVEKAEKLIPQFEEIVASKHAAQLLQEVAIDKAVEEAASAYDNLRAAVIREALMATESQDQFLKVAAQIRAVERLHDQYDPSNWESIAHLLPPIE